MNLKHKVSQFFLSRQSTQKKKSSRRFIFEKTKHLCFILADYRKGEITKARAFARNFPESKTSFLLWKQDYEPNEVVLATFFNEKDFGWMGKPSSDALKTFLMDEYDLLVDWSLGKNKWIKTIRPLIKTPLILTSFADDESDLSIFKKNEEEDLFQEEALKYLKLIG